MVTAVYSTLSRCMALPAEHGIFSDIGPEGVSEYPCASVVTGQAEFEGLEYHKALLGKIVKRGDEMSNEFLELCRRRHSIRKFTAEPIPEGALQQILEAVQRAPSAGNLQAYEIVIVKEPQTKQMLASAAFGQGFVADAQVVLVFFALPQTSAKVYGDRGAMLYAIQDATIACTYAMLAATSLNLATTWVGAFSDKEVKAAIGVGVRHVPVALLPLGYAGEKPYRTNRRPFQDIVREII